MNRPYYSCEQKEMDFIKKLTVLLQNCRIVEQDNSNVEIVKTVSTSKFSFEYAEKSHDAPLSYVIYDFEGRKYMSLPIRKSKIAIQIELYKRTETHIYIYADDSIFFDLDFLFNE